MRIVLIGTGNLATRVGIALRAKGVEIIQVYGRTESNAARLASLLDAPFTTSKKEIRTNADLYLLAVSDEAIPEVIADIPISDQLVVHTAGSVSIDILAQVSKNYGGFYTLQTLSKQKEVDFSTVPICIEANNAENLAKLKVLAEHISNQVVTVDSAQRRQLHLAAVFACNFVNHFYSIGEELLHEQQLDFDLLKPLIMETAGKAMHHSPRTVQTGPAIRNNKAIMELHLKMLEQHPEWQKLYELISREISRAQQV